MNEVVDVSAGRAGAAREPAVCPECSEEVRVSHHPSGALLLLCGSCEWHRVVPPSGEGDTWVPVPRGSSDWVHGHLPEPAPDGVSVVDLRP